MSTELISRHVPRISEDSNGSNDVDMLLSSEGLAKSSRVGPVVPESVDGVERSGSGVHHHHYHYFYHHHFHHLSGHHHSSTPQTAQPSRPTLQLPPSSRPSSHSQSSAKNSPGTVSEPDSANSISGLSSPSISPSPTTATPSLSSLNTSALVRTISNGSTFGPIPNWPLNCLTQDTSSDRVLPEVEQADRSTRVPSPTQSSETNSATESISSSDPSPSQTRPLTSNTTTTTIQATPTQLSLPELELPVVFGDHFILTSQIEASNLYRCLDTDSMEEFCCKVVLSKNYYDFLSPHLRMDGHEGINQVHKIVVGRVHTFILFPPSFGDLHSYVRNKRKLREWEAMPLFQQIVQIVADCHSNGIILRDLKLRKFIFSDKERTQLKLETLEGAALFEEDDTLADKHGCPAYVSPEILYSNAYSGTAADCWSLGVILYTMLVGRYPFHDTNPSVVFCKIRRGTYCIPESLSKQAKCLIRSLIRIDPAQRLSADDALAHHWFQTTRATPPVTKRTTSSSHTGSSHHSLSLPTAPSATSPPAGRSLAMSPCCLGPATASPSLDQIVPDLMHH